MCGIEGHLGMDRKSDRVLTALLYTSLVTGYVFAMLLNEHNRLMISVAMCILLTSVSIRHMLLYPSSRLSRFGRYTMLFDLAIVYWIYLMDASGISQIFFFVLIGDSLLVYPVSYGVSMTALSYVSLVTARVVQGKLSGVVDASLHALSFLFVFSFVYVARLQISQQARLRRAMDELAEKSAELSAAYSDLESTNRALEEMTVLRERNKIAREIHDTVGHTLTTVLVSIEAGRRLARDGHPDAERHLQAAQAQVRKGLDEIRRSVRALREPQSPDEFVGSLESLVEDTVSSTGVRVETHLSPLPPLNTARQRVLFRALQEGITNGIRHGRATRFEFRLDVSGSEISFSLKDNGRGCESAEFGFGLGTIAEDVKQLGGSLSLLPGVGGGCSLLLRLPVGREPLCENL